MKAPPAGITRSAEAGFTLVELTVALALFGLLSLALFGSIRVGMTAWMQGTMRADQVDQTLHVQNLLRQLLEDAYPLFIPEGSDGGHIDFDGTAESLGFLASTPMALGSGGRSRFVLSAIRRGEQADLVLTWKLELATAPPEPIMKALVAGARRVEFSYFGTARSDRAASWHEAWSGQTALPRLLRVRVSFADGDPRTWPDLLIGPRIGADVACVYDPLTDRCKGR